ncbi:MAG: hypothetical protein AAFX99_19485, partial [Myxococcota bacterium]
MKSHSHSRWAIGLYPTLLFTGLAMGIITTLTLNVMADGDPTTDSVPRSLPYQGTLEVNGEPLNALGADALNIRSVIKLE